MLDIVLELSQIKFFCLGLVVGAKALLTVVRKHTFEEVTCRMEENYAKPISSIILPGAVINIRGLSRSKHSSSRANRVTIKIITCIKEFLHHSSLIDISVREIKSSFLVLNSIIEPSLEGHALVTLALRPKSKAAPTVHHIIAPLPVVLRAVLHMYPPFHAAVVVPQAFVDLAFS